jgi:2-polyprenyl-3-methyl-5-hydroxy-6-metoxy-1,4-benzoquinol methylase
MELQTVGVALAKKGLAMATLADKTFDQAKSDAFAERMINVLNESGVALMTSIGHQVGLFDKMAGMPSSTSRQLAEAAMLNERYVREWLAALVTGRVLDYNPADETYSLPPEHAAWLTRAAGTDNLALQAQYVPLLAQVEEPLVEAFRNGGGVPYSAYPRFQRIMAEESMAVHDASLLETILPLVPGLVERLRSGIDVADIGCGSGHAVNLMAREFPNSRFTGYDFSEDGIGTARAESLRLGLSNARFELRDVSTLSLNGSFDLVTAFDAIHDQAHPARVLNAIAVSLRPDGVLLMVDIKASSHLHENMDLGLAPFLYTVSCMHCMTVSLALDGTGLGTMWGEQKARQMLADAGFGHTDVKQVEGDIFNAYFIATKA